MRQCRTAGRVGTVGQWQRGSRTVGPGSLSRASRRVRARNARPGISGPWVCKKAFGSRPSGSVRTRQLKAESNFSFSRCGRLLPGLVAIEQEVTACTPWVFKVLMSASSKPFVPWIASTLRCPAIMTDRASMTDSTRMISCMSSTAAAFQRPVERSGKKTCRFLVAVRRSWSTRP